MHDVGPTLIGPGVVLRPPSVTDVDAISEAMAETADGLRRWMAWFHDGYLPGGTSEWVNVVRRRWETDEEYAFVITEVGAPGVVLGACGLASVDPVHLRADLGYWVRTSASGRGVATESAALAAHWGLGDMRLHRIEIVAAVGNGASQRVAAKVGAVREGVARNRFLLGGTACDGVVFSLVPADLGLARDGRREPG